MILSSLSGYHFPNLQFPLNFFQNLEFGDSREKIINKVTFNSRKFLFCCSFQFFSKDVHLLCLSVVFTDPLVHNLSICNLNSMCTALLCSLSINCSFIVCTVNEATRSLHSCSVDSVALTVFVYLNYTIIVFEYVRVFEWVPFFLQYCISQWALILCLPYWYHSFAQF